MQKLLDWIDARFPLTALWESQWGKYVAPKNFNFWYYFGSLAALVLVMQIVTGIFLTMNYKPDAAKAFELGRVHHARRASGAGSSATCTPPARRCSSSSSTCTCSAGCMYGSYRKPRELLWIFGCLIYLCADGRGVLRLPAAVGPDVVLGRAGDRQPVQLDAVHRRGPRRCGSAATTRSPTSR